MRVFCFAVLVALFFAAGCAENPTSNQSDGFVVMSAGVAGDSTSTDSIIVEPKPIYPISYCLDTVFWDVIPGGHSSEPFLGYRDAKAEIVVTGFLDDEDLRGWWPSLERLRFLYGNRLKIVFVNMYPDDNMNLVVEPSMLAAACEAATKLGRFWEFARIMTLKQPHPTLAELEGYAEDAGMNLQEFRRLMSQSATAREVENDWQFTNNFGHRTCCVFDSTGGGCGVEIHNSAIFVGTRWYGYVRFFPSDPPDLYKIGAFIDELANRPQKPIHDPVSHGPKPKEIPGPVSGS